MIIQRRSLSQSVTIALALIVALGLLQRSVPSAASQALSAVIPRSAGDSLVRPPADTATEPEAVQIDTYVEDFSTYEFKAYSDQANWDVFQGGLKLQPTSGGAHRYSDVAPDGVGGAFIVWQDLRNNQGDGNWDIYAQRVDARGNRLWAADLRVNSDAGARFQGYPLVQVDSTGNALVVWVDDREEPAAKAVYAQKISRSGVKLWPGDVRVNGPSSYRVSWWLDSMAIAVDRQGNLIVAWQGIWDGYWDDSDIHAQKLSPTGQRLWPADVRVHHDTGHRQTFVALDTFDQGDVLVSWIDERYGGEDVYAQRLDAQGQRLWTSDVKVSAGLATPAQGNLSVVADTSGSAIVVWRQGPADPPLSGATSSIVAQRLGADGRLLWSGNRRVNRDTSIVFRGHPRADRIPTGQVIVVWEDARRGFELGTVDVFAQLLRLDGVTAWAADQRVNPESWSNWNIKPRVAVAGNLAWLSWETDDNVHIQQFDTAGVRPVLPLPSQANESDGRIDQTEPAIANLAGNELIVGWHDVTTNNWDVRIQKLTVDGSLAWPLGVLVNDAAVRMKRQRVQMAANGQNNTLVVWHDERGGIYGRLMSAAGVQMWSADVRLDTRLRQAYHPAVRALSDGSFVVAWLERRHLAGDLWDVYVQRFDVEGGRLWPADVRANSSDNRLSDIDPRSKPELAIDSQGHIVVAWRGDAGSGIDVFVRRFSPNGNPAWNVQRALNAHLLELNGRFWDRVFAAQASNTILVVTASAAGGQRGLRLHRLDLSGNPMGATPPWIDATSQETFYGNPSISSAGASSVVVAWDEEYGPRNAYALRVDLTGQPLWPAKVQLNEDLVWPLRPALSGQVASDFVVAWNDERFGDNNIYARRIAQDGALIWDADLRVTPEEGFYAREGMAESLAVNGVGGVIDRVSLLPQQSLNGGQISYFLTNNGGQDWEEIAPGTIHEFSSQGNGDLRWRTVLRSGHDWRETPVVHRLMLRYGPDLVGDAYEPNDICGQALAILADATTQRHVFYWQADADWISFEAIQGTRYLIEAHPEAGSRADIALELHGQCSSLPLATQNHTFSPGVRLDFTAPYTGPVFLRLTNYQPEVFGPDVSYVTSVRALADQNTPGALILVAGRKRSGDPLQPNIHHVSDAVYALFRNHGYTDDRIFYLATEGRPGVDAQPTVENLRLAITDWAVSRVGPQRPLTVFLVDHGSHNAVYLDSPSQQWVSPAQLDGWLSQLQALHPGVKVNLVIEACNSGSFIEPPHTASRLGRLVITSTSSTALAWASTPGAVFSDHFIASLGQEATMAGAFLTAQAAVVGTGNPQHPWVDGDGDGIANEVEDMAEAAMRGFSYPGTLLDQWPPYILPLQQPISISNGTALLRIEVRDDTAVDRVWAVIYAPSYEPPASQDELVWEQIVSVNLAPEGGGWYRTNYPGFSELGAYRIVYYAKDNEGLQSVPLEAIAWNAERVFLPILLRR